MSPKICLAHGPTFHLYIKTFEDDKIYLELSNVQFEAGRDKYQMTGNAIERVFILVSLKNSSTAQYLTTSGNSVTSIICFA